MNGFQKLKALRTIVGFGRNNVEPAGRARVKRANRTLPFDCLPRRSGQLIPEGDAPRSSVHRRFAAGRKPVILFGTTGEGAMDFKAWKNKNTCGKKAR
jgi:hypothetical protein